jgi:Beta-propeller repeat
MREARLTTIALCVVLVGACGQRKRMTRDGAIDAGPVAVDTGPDRGQRPDQFIAAASWAVSADVDSGNGHGNAIAVDGAGNSYVTGNFYGMATFGSTTLTSATGDIFVAKLDSDGTFVWVASAGGGTADSYSIDLDGSGSSYITGKFRGTATFGSKLLTAKGDSDIFVAKLDSGGTFVWAVSAGGGAADSGSSIGVDSAGNSYITGNFISSASFGGTTLTSKGHALFVAKLNSSGTFVWAVSSDGTSSYGNSIAVDASGSTYVVGDFIGTVSLGSASLTAKAGRDNFVAKLDSSGTLVWAASAGGSWGCYGTSIAIDGAGNCYVTGYFIGAATFGSTTLSVKGQSDLFVAKLNSSGTFVWAVSAGGTTGDYGRSITVDGSGNSYVTGNFIGVATFGSKTLTTKGYNDAFVAKLDSGGTFVWAVSAGGKYGNEHGSSIAVDGSGNSYVTGDFGFNAAFGSTTLTAQNSSIFVAKLDSSGKL